MSSALFLLLFVCSYQSFFYFFICPFIVFLLVVECYLHWRMFLFDNGLWFQNMLCTRTLGAAGPLVLAPMEGVGALRAPCLSFLSFLYFLYFFSSSLSSLSFFCLFCLLCLLCLLCHPTLPPTMFSVPKRNTGKCFERPAKILKGEAKIWRQSWRRRSRRSRSTDNLVLGFWYN